jgi:hypothetical protein
MSGDLLGSYDLVRLRTLLSLHDVKFDLVTFFQALISINLNGAVVDKDIWSVVPPDKTIPLRIVEPLDLTLVLSHEPLTFLTADCGWEVHPSLPTVETQLSALWFSLNVAQH